MTQPLAVVLEASRLRQQPILMTFVAADSKDAVRWC